MAAKTARRDGGRVPPAALDERVLANRDDGGADIAVKDATIEDLEFVPAYKEAQSGRQITKQHDKMDLCADRRFSFRHRTAAPISVLADARASASGDRPYRGDSPCATTHT